MDIKFQSGFLKQAKALAGAVGAILLLWAMWAWHEEILYVGLFAFISVARTMINAALIIGAAFLIGWFIPWLVAKYVLEGVSLPHAPLRIWRYAMITSVVLGLCLVPVYINTDAKITKALEPIADEFTKTAACDWNYCGAPERILEERDKLVRMLGGVRVGGWYVSNISGEGEDFDISAVYLWNPPFFML